MSPWNIVDIVDIDVKLLWNCRYRHQSFAVYQPLIQCRYRRYRRETVVKLSISTPMFCIIWIPEHCRYRRETAVKLSISTPVFSIIWVPETLLISSISTWNCWETVDIDTKVLQYSSEWLVTMHTNMAYTFYLQMHLIISVPYILYSYNYPLVVLIYMSWFNLRNPKYQNYKYTIIISIFFKI